MGLSAARVKVSAPLGTSSPKTCISLVRPGCPSIVLGPGSRAVGLFGLQGHWPRLANGGSFVHTLPAVPRCFSSSLSHLKSSFPSESKEVHAVTGLLHSLFSFSVKLAFFNWERKILGRRKGSPSITLWCPPRPGRKSIGVQSSFSPALRPWAPPSKPACPPLDDRMTPMPAWPNTQDSCEPRRSCAWHYLENQGAQMKAAGGCQQAGGHSLPCRDFLV